MTHAIANPKQLWRVKKLVVDRVDLVDVGASLDKRTGEGAHVLLFKRAAAARQGEPRIRNAASPLEVVPRPTLRKMAYDLLHQRARLEGKTPATVLANDAELRACLIEMERVGIHRGEPLAGLEP